MLTPKRESTMLAEAARTGRVVTVTRSSGSDLRVAVQYMGHGPTVQFLVLKGEPLLRIDPPCPEGQDPGQWGATCDRLVRRFEPMLCHALGLPALGRMTRHLAEFAWI